MKDRDIARTVFISGVSAEFKEAREKTAKWLRQLKHRPIEQADFRQTPSRLLTNIKKDISESDVVILFIGDCYGVPVPSNLAKEFQPQDAPLEYSYTQFEFYTAIELGKRCYLFHPKKSIFDLSCDETGKAHRECTCSECETLKLDNELQTKYFNGPVKKSGLQWIDYSNLPEVIEEVTKIDFETFGTKLNPVNPYKGLERFTEADKGDFKGRDSEIDLLVERAREETLILIKGHSGSGKSSLIRAGLIPAWKEANSKGLVITFDLDSDPFVSLRTALLQEVAVSQDESQWVLDDSDIDSRCNVFHELQRISSLQGKNILFIIDQFERIFLRCKCDKTRAEFVDSLIAISQHQSANVIIVMRDDFDGCMKFRGLSDITDPNSYRIRNLVEKELKEIIITPANQNGVDVEPKLVEQILEEIGDIDPYGSNNKAVLPLLQVSLHQLWEEKQLDTKSISSPSLTLNKYIAIGGLKGALKNKLESLYSKLRNSNEQNRFRSVFLSLVDLDYETAISKSEKKQVLISIGGEELIEELIEERILTAGGGEDTVELVHETLIFGWDNFKKWHDENRGLYRLKNRLEEDANKSGDYFWSGGILSELDSAINNGVLDRSTFSSQALEFLAKSKRKETERIETLQQEKNRAEQAKKAAEIEKQHAQEERERAEISEKSAIEERLRAKTSENFALKEQDRAKKALQIAKKQKRRAISAAGIAALTSLVAIGLVLFSNDLRLDLNQKQKDLTVLEKEVEQKELNLNELEDIYNAKVKEEQTKFKQIVADQEATFEENVAKQKIELNELVSQREELEKELEQRRVDLQRAVEALNANEEQLFKDLEAANRFNSDKSRQPNLQSINDLFSFRKSVNDLGVRCGATKNLSRRCIDQIESLQYKFVLASDQVSEAIINSRIPNRSKLKFHEEFENGNIEHIRCFEQLSKSNHLQTLVRTDITLSIAKLEAFFGFNPRTGEKSIFPRKQEFRELEALVKKKEQDSDIKPDILFRYKTLVPRIKYFFATIYRFQWGEVYLDECVVLANESLIALKKLRDDHDLAESLRNESKVPEEVHSLIADLEFLICSAELERSSYRAVSASDSGAALDKVLYVEKDSEEKRHQYSLFLAKHYYRVLNNKTSARRTLSVREDDEEKEFPPSGLLNIEEASDTVSQRMLRIEIEDFRHAICMNERTEDKNYLKNQVNELVKDARLNGLIPAYSLDWLEGITDQPDRFYLNNSPLEFVGIVGKPSIAVSTTELTYMDFLEFSKSNHNLDAAWGIEKTEDEWRIKDRPHFDWRELNFILGNNVDNPVVGVSFNSAQLFCQWLSNKHSIQEVGAQKVIRFRLPTEDEWHAFGTSGRVLTDQAIYPWGGFRLPKRGLQWGNFGGLEVEEQVPGQFTTRDSIINRDIGYRDGFPMLEPLSIENLYGHSDIAASLYHLEGNVSEWVVSESGEPKVRGGCWLDSDPELLRLDINRPFTRSGSSKSTDRYPADIGFPWIGFRIVAELEVENPPSEEPSSERMGQEIN